ncbi:hypothetical protein ABZP36_001645 [Zizania latifolia]
MGSTWGPSLPEPISSEYSRKNNGLVGPAHHAMMGPRKRGHPHAQLIWTPEDTPATRQLPGLAAEAANTSPEESASAPPWQQRLWREGNCGRAWRWKVPGDGLIAGRLAMEGEVPPPQPRSPARRRWVAWTQPPSSARQ